MYTIYEFENYLKQYSDLESAMDNLSDENIVKANPINYKLSHNRTDENLVKYEISIGMTALKEQKKRTYYRTDKKEGKYWMACSPRWIKEGSDLDTKYEICYWVNYGDDETYGMFTVEQIQQWLTTPDLKLYELGGTRERMAR